MKLRIKNILKAAVSLSLLGLILLLVDVGEILDGMRRLSATFIVFALVFYAGCQWLSCLRWQIILRAIGQSISMRSLLSSYFGGMFLNTFLPGAVSGDVYRVYRIARKSQESELAFVSVFLERSTGVFALLAIALISIPPAFSAVGRWDIVSLLVLCTIVLASIVLLIASPKALALVEPLLRKVKLEGIALRLVRIQTLMRQFAQDRLALTLTLVLSLIFQLLVVLYYYLIARQLDIPVSYLQLLVFTAIIVVITFAPISLGGLGVKEGLLTYLFSRVGLTLEQALLLSLTVTALAWILSLPGGLVLLLDSTGFKEAKERQRP